MSTAVAALSGLLFALGLGVAGMTRPSKVIGFLDFAGDWDPSLMATMAGAVGVNALFWIFTRRRGRPLLGEALQVPTRRDLDPRLLAGAALFGVGWGLGGYCPGPAITGAVSGGLPVAVFLVTMLAGMALHRVWDARVAAAGRAP